MNSGHPAPQFFLRDSWARFKRPLTPSAIGAVIVFLATVAMFATVGWALSDQQRTLDRINSPQGRLITITDRQGKAGLVASNVDLSLSFSGVEWAIGVGPALDATNVNIPGGGSVISRTFFGRQSAVFWTNVSGKVPPGSAVADRTAAKTLGFRDGVGTVVTRQRSADVVGQYRVQEPLSSLSGQVLIIDPIGSDQQRIATLWVSVKDVNDLERVAKALSDSLVLAGPGNVSIDVSDDLAKLSRDIVARMSQSAALGVGGTLIVVVLLLGALQFGRVSAMSRDIGRVRAMGATRSAVMVQVILNALWGAVIGTVLGTAVGFVSVLVMTGGAPPPGFTWGIPVLMILAALAGAVLPAFRAARVDPVRMLRVP